MGTFQSVLGISQYILFDINRVKGTFFNPNFFAGYLAAILVLGVGLMLDNDEKKRVKITLSFSLPLILIAIFLTQSRGGLFSLLVGLFFVLLYRFRKRAILFYAVILLSILIIPNPVVQRLKTVKITDPYAYSRIEMWKSSFPRIMENPLGAGLGIYKYTSQRHAFPVEEAVARYGKKAETAHNEYLQIAVELGVLGFFTFLWGIFLVVKEGLLAIQVLKTKRLGFPVGGAVGLLGGIIAILSHGLVDSNLHQPSVVILLIIFVGTIIAINKIYSDDKKRVFIIRKREGRFYYVSFILIAILLTILIVRPCIAYYLYSYGEKNSKKGDLNRAAELFRWAILFDPGNTSYHYSLSASAFYKFQEDRDPKLINEAVSELNYAKVLNPINTLFPNRLAFIYQNLAVSTKDSTERKKFLEEAEKNYKESIQLSPFYASNYAGLGEVYFALGDKGQAKREFIKALELEPRFLPVRYKLALLYEEEGQTELAEAEYRAIIEIKERYTNKTKHDLEEQYLDVDIADVKKRLDLLKAK